MKKEIKKGLRTMTEEEYMNASEEKKFRYIQENTIKIIEKFMNETRDYLLSLTKEGNLPRVPLFIAYISPFTKERAEKKEEEMGSLSLMMNRDYLALSDIHEIVKENILRFFGGTPHKFTAEKNEETNSISKYIIQQEENVFISIDKDITSGTEFPPLKD